MEYHFISIYPLSEIEKINYYSGPFCGITYDSEEKIKVAREMAKWFAEIKPYDGWNSYYPDNEQMAIIIKLVYELMNSQSITRSIKDEQFRLSMIVYHFMNIKNLFSFRSYKSMLIHSQIIKELIAHAINE